MLNPDIFFYLGETEVKHDGMLILFRAVKHVLEWKVVGRSLGLVTPVLRERNDRCP